MVPKHSKWSIWIEKIYVNLVSFFPKCLGSKYSEIKIKTVCQDNAWNTGIYFIIPHNDISQSWLVLSGHHIFQFG